MRTLSNGCCIDEHYTGAICSADDLALIALFEAAMQRMLDVVSQHSKRWRYQHNVPKCMCLSFGSNTCQCNVKLGDTTIPQVRSAPHLGVNLYRRQSKEAIEYTESRVLHSKKSFYPMLGIARSGSLLNPMIASKMYWSVCVSSLTYGIEVWDTCEKDEQILDKAHRSMSKTIQGLPRNVANDGVLIPLGWQSIQGYIDKKRCMFIGSLLDCSKDSFPKVIVINRLVEICYGSSNGHRHIRSPLRLMYDSCKRLGMLSDLYEAVDNGGVDDLAQWRKAVDRAVQTMDSNKSIVAISLHPSLRYMLPLVSEKQICEWWLLSDKFPRYRKKCNVIVCLLMGSLKGIEYDNGRKCGLCHSENDKDGVSHFLMTCMHAGLVQLRHQVLDCVKNALGLEIVLETEDIISLCLSGIFGDDSTLKHVADMIYEMYQLRIRVLKGNR